jgi:hypothetical protein
MPAAPGSNVTDGTETNAEPQPRDQSIRKDDLREALKRGLEKTRLPADVKEQILAELPPLEEHERLYRELMEKGGLSFEEFFESLVKEVESQP